MFLKHQEMHLYLDLKQDYILNRKKMFLIDEKMFFSSFDICGENKTTLYLHVKLKNGK
jgi:hypothetical protein